MMRDLTKLYLKKVKKETNDPEIKDAISDMLGDYTDLPSFMRPKSSFREANKKMSEIENGRREEEKD